MPIFYNDLAFRSLFPGLATSSQYASSIPQTYWNVATAYLSNCNGRCYTGGMNLQQQTLALNLMTAHLIFLNNLVNTGNSPGITTGATIDKVSVTLQPPPEVNEWQYWLNQSPYGQQLLALLQVASVGGSYITTGVPGRAGFQFGNGW
jgi:hypothetical protein